MEPVVHANYEAALSHGLQVATGPQILATGFRQLAFSLQNSTQRLQNNHKSCFRMADIPLCAAPFVLLVQPATCVFTIPMQTQINRCFLLFHLLPPFVRKGLFLSIVIFSASASRFGISPLARIRVQWTLSMMFHKDGSVTFSLNAPEMRLTLSRLCTSVWDSHFGAFVTLRASGLIWFLCLATLQFSVLLV